MFKLIGKLEKKCYVACSGGKDSMMVLHFLLKGRRDVEVLHVNHNTQYAHTAESFIKNFCQKNNIPFHIGRYSQDVETEEAWRNFRYDFFKNYTDRPIYLGHQLDDNIETWLMSSIKGTSKFIPYQRDNIIRPFLLTSREEIDSYVSTHNVKWIEDPSNSESNYDRNNIRNNVIPVLKEINPGLYKTFKNKCIDKYTKDGIL